MTIKYARTDNQTKRILKITFERETDTDPDLSNLGEYSNSPSGDYSIDREKRGHRLSHEFRYFNTSGNYSGQSKRTIKRYTEEDYKRAEAYNRCEWCMVFCVALAKVSINGVMQTVQSGGLSGVESDSDESYFDEIRDEQVSELSDILESMGFSKEAIKAAIGEMGGK